MSWARYEGHGNPVCPACADAYAESDPHWWAHASAYRWDREAAMRGEESYVCHGCGAPVPVDERMIDTLNFAFGAWEDIRAFLRKEVGPAYLRAKYK